jgi:hypothetical protein
MAYPVPERSDIYRIIRRQPYMEVLGKMENVSSAWFLAPGFSRFSSVFLGRRPRTRSTYYLTAIGWQIFISF